VTPVPMEGQSVAGLTRQFATGPLECRFPEITPNPENRPMGIQHAPKSQRNASKKRRKARKHKLRSTKKYKAK
jgi:hypothetical protein